MRLCAMQKPEGVTGPAQAAIESVCDIQLSCTGKKGDVTHWSLCVWGAGLPGSSPLLFRILFYLYFF